MIFTLPEVLVRVRPGAKWKLTDIHDYKTLEWIDENQTKPTLEELTNNHEQLIDAQPLKELRQERNRRLSECDWVVIRATSTDTPIPEEWKVYMQALRDLPSTTEDPANPVWPTPPE
jgi:hypothetical protein